MTDPSGTHRRVQRMNASGFALIETGVALAILAVAMLLVMQLGYWSLKHRSRTAARFAATELAANLLEHAQAVPWEMLTDDWAAAQDIPDELADQLPEGQLTVRIEAVEQQALLKRVTVELRWHSNGEPQSQSTHLVGYFCRRAVATQDVEP